MYALYVSMYVCTYNTYSTCLLACCVPDAGERYVLKPPVESPRRKIPSSTPCDVRRSIFSPASSILLATACRICRPLLLKLPDYIYEPRFSRRYPSLSWRRSFAQHLGRSARLSHFFGEGVWPQRPKATEMEGNVAALTDSVGSHTPLPLSCMRGPPDVEPLPSQERPLTKGSCSRERR